MTATEIKKELYKQKPAAHFLHLRKIGLTAVLVYGTWFSSADGTPGLIFEIPVDELADGLFDKTIQAQLLIRYLVHSQTFQP